MLLGASGDIVAKVGDTFVVHMDREALNDYPLGLYDVTIEIVTFEPDQERHSRMHRTSQERTIGYSARSTSAGFSRAVFRPGQ